MIDSKLLDCLYEHEGYRRSAYQDSEGYWTVGIGFCVDESLGLGLSIDECMLILNMRLKSLKRRLNTYSWFVSQDEIRQAVLMELAYNMGIGGLKTFKKCLAAVEKKDYVRAGDELLDSKWARQVGVSRRNNIVHRMVEGEYP